VFAGTEGNLPLLIASSKFTISEGFATATTTYRHQQTQVPDSNSVALVSVEASRQFAPREVRSFEVEHVNSCWHLDFHTGSGSVLTAKGT
jgi:hypothetical protein